MTEAIEILKQQGAVIVDPADIPSVVTADPDHNLLLWNQCSGVDGAKGQDADCSVVLKYGMKRDFNKWLASLGPSAPVASLTALREWNITHTKAGAIKYGQSNLDISDEMDVEADRADAQNKLWHRMEVRRLEGEAIRDAMLAVSGRADLTMYGPGVMPYLTEYMAGKGRPATSGPAALQ